MTFKRIAVAVLLLISAACSQARVGSGGLTGSGGLGGINAVPEPRLTIVTPSLPPGQLGVAYSQTIRAVYGRTPYTWSLQSGVLPTGYTLNASTGVISGTTSSPGSYHFRVRVADSNSKIASRDYTITVGCAPMQITTPLVFPIALQGTAFTYQMNVSGGSGALTWSLVAGAFPTSEVMNSVGAVSGTPSTTGDYSMTIKVVDSCPVTPQTQQNVFTQHVDSNLAFTTPSPLPNPQVGVPYIQQIAAAGGTSPYLFSNLTALPAGLVINSAGKISGTPTTVQALSPNIQVLDALSTARTQLFSMTVNCPAVGITDLNPLPGAIVGQQYNHQMQGIGFLPLGWTGLGFPPGISMNGTGLITGVATIAGSYNPNITETDSCPAGGQSQTQAYGITVTANNTNPVQLVAPNPFPSGTVQVFYSNPLSATGGTPPYAYSKPSGSFPAGITLSGSTISGTPTTAQTTTPTLRVTDSLGATNDGSSPYSITIACPLFSIATPSTINPGTQGTLFQQQLATSGGIGTVTWALLSGAFPTGESVSGSGLISGTPGASGTFTFTLTATDSCSTPTVKTKTFTQQVNGNLAILTPGTLPTGTIEQQYSFPLTAIGGTGPYTWTVTSGSFIVSMNSAGVISGTVEDVLDWLGMDSRRTASHLSGSGNPHYNWLDADGEKQWTIKASTMHPWDIWVYGSFGQTNNCPDDSSGLPQVCHWITENATEGAFASAIAYKRAVTPQRGLPRYFADGSTYQITNAGPAPLHRTLNCELDGEPIINLGQNEGDLSGPTNIAWGGSVGTQPTLLGTRFYSFSGGVYQDREQYWFVKGWGRVQWTHAAWNGAAYVVDNTTNTITLSNGGSTSPNFPCYGTTPGWIGGAPGANGDAAQPGSSTPAVTTTATVTVTDSLAATVSKTFTLSFNPIPSVISGGADNRNCNVNETTNFTSTTDGPSQQLQKCVRTAVADTPSPGATVTATAGSFTSVQSLVNAANCGDTILIPASSAGTQFVYAGQVLFPAKPCDNAHWVTIKTDQSQNLPPEGTRATPAWVGLGSIPGRPTYSQPAALGIYMPKFINGGLVWNFAAGANHYRLIGLEVTSTNGVNVSNLTQVAAGADHIIYDRLVMHGGNSPNWQDRDSVTRAVSWNGVTYGAVVDSYIADTHCVVGGTCTDSQAILAGGNSSLPEGPFKFVNLFLETAAEPILFGGGGANAATTIPNDAEIRRNHFFKPLFWKVNDPSYFGTNFEVKNNSELKTGNRVLFEGNIFDTTWQGQADQKAFQLLIGPKNQSSSFGGTASSDGVGGITKLSGAFAFNSSQVSPLCAVANHCRIKYNGIVYLTNTVIDGTHITVGPNPASGLLPPVTSSASFTAFQPGQNPNAAVTNVVARYNRYMHSGNAYEIFVQSSDGGDNGKGASNISIHDEILDDIDGAKWCSYASIANCGFAWSLGLGQISNDTPAPNNLHDVTIKHVTALPRDSFTSFPPGSIGPGIAFIHQSVAATSISNLKIYDNILPGGLVLDQPGICGGSRITDATVAFNCITSVGGVGPSSGCFDHNGISTTTATSLTVTGTSNNPPYPSASPNCGFTVTGNHLVGSYDAVLFVNLNAANGGDYHLQAGSPFHNAASDGKDMGADVDLVDQNTNGVY